jgi:hypothetical protein
METDSIFSLIKTGKLTISKEKGNTLIRLELNRYRLPNGIIECHFLYWHDGPNFPDFENFDFFKDSVLNNNCVYRVGVTTDHSGW